MLFILIAVFWGAPLNSVNESLIHLNLVPSSLASSCVNDLVSKYSPRSVAFCAL